MSWIWAPKATNSDSDFHRIFLGEMHAVIKPENLSSDEM